jgi:hypothetical protein
MGDLRNYQTYFSSSHFRNLECHLLTSLIRASLVGRWMFCSNGNLAILDENQFPVVSAYLSPSSAPRHFHCRICYPAGRCCALNIPQDGRYGCVRGDKGQINAAILTHAWSHWPPTAHPLPFSCHTSNVNSQRSHHRPLSSRVHNDRRNHTLRGSVNLSRARPAW